MLSDFEMIVHSIPTENDITIYPISDLHLGALEHMEREWIDFCTHELTKDNTYVVLGGDLLQNSTRSSVSNVFDQIMRPREQKKLMVKMLEPIRDHLLCAVTGNHERRSGREVDDDLTYDIMCKLDLEHLYRENIAFVTVRLGLDERKSSNSKYRPSYTIVVTHGTGGGIYTGAAINRNERFGYTIDGMDCLIVGHTHKPFVSQPNKIVIDRCNDLVTFKPFKVVSSTSWLAYGGYAAQKMLLPASNAPQKIQLSAYKKKLTVTM